MLVDGKPYRTIWLADDEPGLVRIIDQRKLPFRFEIADLRTTEDAARAIVEMYVRGAGLIGATAAAGMYLAAIESAAEEDFEASIQKRADFLCEQRPTAVNLRWAVERSLGELAAENSTESKIAAARQTAIDVADEDADFCRRIGEHGLDLIREIHEKKGGGDAVVNLLTHCNAGWLAFVDYGSATAPMYAAHDAGIPIHVWVDETRPRNQGARLTAWELGQHGVPHTVVADNVGGHLMQNGLVDLVITGTDRTTFTGDVANKIGTYLKALAAKDNGIPFCVALPSSTFDWQIRDGVREIPIEQRGGEEVTVMSGVPENGDDEIEIRISPETSPAANFAFDVTPARLVSKLITERGICEASEEGVRSLYPENFA
ncbi:MAG: S-methyl-5-thioribose-1-phosphate isomerase [Verrucomicrobiales bacterium]|nr:S-methyl-5-thioribose-1-phosphate isomerase [Verrucomicrobiales bacterium]